MEEPHTKTEEEIVEYFGTDKSSGLTQDQVSRQLEKYGANEPPPEKHIPVWKLILHQFEDPLVRILLTSAVVLAVSDLWLGDLSALVEPVVILFILVANAVVEIVQERNREDAVKSTNDLEPDVATVVRKNQRGVQRINTRDLVPGDIVEVAAGDIVPADIRLFKIYSTTLQVDESTLIGDSEPVVKHTRILHDRSIPFKYKTNMVFAGTAILIGKSRGVVVGTGCQTVSWNCTLEGQSSEHETTPLQHKIEEFGEQLSKVVTVVCIGVWAINIGHFSDPSHGGSLLKGAIYYFKVAVALAVAAIPEGLPTVITTCLALGTRRLAKNNVVVRSLPSVETLGCTSVICSDKTGTLTTNEMSVCRMMIFQDNERRIQNRPFQITGKDYAPVGHVFSEGQRVICGDFNALHELATIASMCNDSTVDYNEPKGVYEKVGEATEAALTVLVEKMNVDNIDKSGLTKMEFGTACNTNIHKMWQKDFTLEFTKVRKAMSVYCTPSDVPEADRKAKIFMKGAPETILERCEFVRVDSDTLPLTQSLQDEVMATVKEWGGERDMLRCLALATIDEPSDRSQMTIEDSSNCEEYEQHGTFVGLVGIYDPPSVEIKSSIQRCHSAGIRVVAITGDSKSYAENICRKVGIFTDAEDTEGKSFTGREFQNMSSKDQLRAVQHARLFSRVDPADRSEIIQYLQVSGEVSLFTGREVSDAPALRHAEIGMAMGSGTAVAKSSSKMVLADDNFSTIVSALEEGRAIYNNTKQFIRYLISSNLGEVVSIFLTAALGMPEALIPVQLLWVNLVTDGLPATALGFNPPDLDIMNRPPRKAKDHLISDWMLFRYVAIGSYIGFAKVSGAAWWLMMYVDGPQLSFHQLTHYTECGHGSAGFEGVDCHVFHDTKPITMVLSVLVIIEMLNALNSISDNQSLIRLPPWSNLWLIAAIVLSMLLHLLVLEVQILANVFEVTSLNFAEWAAVVKISFPVVLIDETLKYLSRVYAKRDCLLTELFWLLSVWVTTVALFIVSPI